MSKKIIIIFIILLIVGVFGYFLTGSKTVTNPDGTTSTDSNGIDFKKFFPLGGTNTTNTTDNNPQTTQPDENINENEVKGGEYKVLKQITNFPVAGIQSFTEKRLKVAPVTEETISEDSTTPKTDGKPAVPEIEDVTTVRYAQKSNGNIWRYFIDEQKSTKITNTIIPLITEAYFTSRDTVIYRFTTGDNTIKTFYGNIQIDPKNIVSQISQEYPVELKGSFFADKIPWLASSSEVNKVFYLEPSSDTTVNGVVSMGDNTKRALIWNSAFTEWIPTWINAKTIQLQTTASSQASGLIYTLDIEKKTISRIMGDMFGLTGLVSHDLKNIIYSRYNNNTVETNIYERASGTNYNLNVSTFAEKCIWTKDNKNIYCGVPNEIPSGQYPDDWYQGTVSFSDSIWKIDTGFKFGSKIADLPQLSNTVIDMTNPTLSPDETYLFFINKNDGTLWSLDLAPDKHRPATTTAQ